jgi:hypothetical protein
MGIGVSLILIAVGAILTWAVNATVSGLNITTSTPSGSSSWSSGPPASFCR